VNDAAWWARAVQPRAGRDDLRPQRLWTPRKRVHGGRLRSMRVVGIGAEIVLTVDGRVADDPAVPVARAGGSGVCDGQRRHNGLSVRERRCDQRSAAAR
jgi:hypothetical protein